jgi:TPR repeat protein
LAFRWGLRAAERGHVDAQFNTGVFYENGEGVEVGAYSR